MEVFAFEFWLEGVHDSDAENHLVHARRRACRSINDPGFVETRACMRADNVLIDTLYIKRSARAHVIVDHERKMVPLGVVVTVICSKVRHGERIDRPKPEIRHEVILRAHFEVVELPRGPTRTIGEARIVYPYIAGRTVHVDVRPCSAHCKFRKAIVDSDADILLGRCLEQLSGCYRAIKP